MNPFFKIFNSDTRGASDTSKSILPLYHEENIAPLIETLNQTIFLIDENEQWSYLNTEWQILTGYSLAESLHTNCIQYIHPDDQEQFKELLKNIYKNNSRSCSTRMRLISKEGSLCWVTLRANSYFSPEHNNIQIVGVLSDINDRVHEFGLQQANFRTISTLINNLCGLVYRGRNDRNWTMEFVSDGCLELTGYQPSEMVNKTVTFGSLINTVDRELVWINVQSALREVRPYEINYRINTRDGIEKWVWERGKGNFSSNGELLSIEGLILDVTDYKRNRLKEDIEVLYKTKEKLPQKHLFIDRLERAIARSETINGYNFSLSIINIDRFSNLQNAFPANIVDKIITHISELINSITSPTASLCLFDDGEFSLLLENAESIDAVMIVINNIIEALLTPLMIENTEIYITVSIGTTFSSNQTGNKDHILDNTYIALGRAKSLGGGRYEIYDEATNAKLHALDRVKKELQYSLQYDELTVCYQPVQALDNSTIASFEALLFWNHPRRGKVPLKSLADHDLDNEIVSQLNTWLMTAIINQTCAWGLMPDLKNKLNINIGFLGKDIFNNQYLEIIEKQLSGKTCNEFKFSIFVPENVIRQLTQSHLNTINKLNKNRDIGIIIESDKAILPATEDLLALPTTLIKINNPFPIEDNNELLIAKAQIDYIHALGKKIIISGIDTREQLDFMKELDCDYIQGNMVYPPLDKDEVINNLLQDKQISQ